MLILKIIFIETTRGIAAQILRHRSFTYQEFSQRYANTNMLGRIAIPELRSQNSKSSDIGGIWVLLSLQSIAMNADWG